MGVQVYRWHTFPLANGFSVSGLIMLCPVQLKVTYEEDESRSRMSTYSYEFNDGHAESLVPWNKESKKQAKPRSYIQSGSGADDLRLSSSGCMCPSHSAALLYSMA